MNLNERLHDLRKKAGYSQEQLAELLGISRQAISKWESGQGNPDIDNIIKLTKIYQVSADYILMGCENEPNGQREPAPLPSKNELSPEMRKALAIITITAGFAVITVLFITALSVMERFVL
ncbi:helix-turn-helix transcriptional regulator [Lachnospiraceae bacterium MD335]|jgi:transcriptional regulator with XRE-family HTH domain|nr:hypothetical protein C809_00283 [Lachnospiraceae bacterium MD335]NDO51674.1 helix-turn-helix transcriptional regulator [Lachnospiraceae bacterium MD335]